MVGAVSPTDDFCRLADEGVGRLARECGAFDFDEALPLQCRCIFLAMMCPVASDSERLEPTLSSVRRILASSSCSPPPTVLNATLLGLPSLFLSLAARKEAAAAKYVTTAMDSFGAENLVKPHATSTFPNVRVSAVLSLARLFRVYTAAMTVAAGERDGHETDQVRGAASYLWNQLNPTTNGMHKIVLSLLSLEECFSFTASTALLRSGFSYHNPIPLCLTKNDPPTQWMASLVYLQSFLALAPESMLRSDNALGFFSDKGHYAMFEKISEEIYDGTKNQTPSQLPFSIWLLLLPFFSYDVSTQKLAANVFGQTLLCNKCKVFSALFVPESEINTNLDIVPKETWRKAVDKLFIEINFLFGFCGLIPDMLFSRPAEKVALISDASIAVGVFTSLCRRSPDVPALGDYVMERSVLALIRIWVASSGRYGFDSEVSAADLTCHASLASSAFNGLSEIFQRNEDSKFVDRIMAKILSEFFLPPHKINPKTRYRLLSVFIGTFLLPRSVIHGLRTVELSSVFEIIAFVDDMYPSVLVQMIKDEDHEAIQMCAAFRMYLLSELKKLNKEEKRIQKKVVNELFVGARQGSGSISRSLVPGVDISTAKLIENAKLLCIKTDVLSWILPQLLLHPSYAPLRFFATNVCQSELNYPDILKEIGLPILKTLVWELGRYDSEEDEEEEIAIEESQKRGDVRLALAKGFLLSEGCELLEIEQSLLSLSRDEPFTGPAGKWISPNFMYLLVNIVLHQWPKRSESEQFQVIRCLKNLLPFLTPSESPQYMPQILTSINNAISSTKTHHISRLRLIAVGTLFDYVKIVTSHDATQVGENLTTIVVALFPLFNEGGSSDHDKDLARSRAVQMLEWLAIGESLTKYFSDVPFLPFTTDLTKVRTLLIEKGVQLDDTRLLSQQSGSQQGIVSSAQLESKFYNRMNKLSQLVMSHDNRNVRQVVIRHMTLLIKTNRDLFQNLILNEELSSVNFLTVVYAPSSLNAALDDEARINGGLITKLLIRLLSRCVDETDPDIRDAIACCLGEMGAIDPNRLGKELSSSQLLTKYTGSDDSSEWRRENAPWKTPVIEYELWLVKHLVSGLLSAPATLDQHKISFAIQELLKILDNQLRGKNAAQTATKEMNSTLKAKLQEADVWSIVEPFWSTNYKQVDTVAAKPPPFFSKSTSYFSWLSSFCRYLVTQSNLNKNTSVWGDFFHACRSAIRSQAGIGVAEFLLPLFILDAVCFGEKTEENVIIHEFVSVLSFERGKSEASPMSLREREKAANVIFTVMDVLRGWCEKEVELRHQPSRAKSRRAKPHVVEENSWPVTESIKKIERLLNRIPLSSCALASSKVGMYATALKFLEIEGRRKAVLNKENHTAEHNDTCVSKWLTSHFIDGMDLHLTQMLLGQLNDFDTMVFVAQESHQTGPSKRLMEEAVEREMYEDWEGAFQAYEQLVGFDNESWSYPSSTLTENTKTSSQKGLLKCLLKLGRLDSVLNQAYGMSKHAANENAMQIRVDFLPSAAEAAWRLGKWSILDELVTTSDDGSAFDAEARYQLSFGRTMHSLHSNSYARVKSCLRDSRNIVMSSLTSAARDGYNRSYPFLMQLHALREIEHVSSLFEDRSNFQESFINVVSSDQWSKRLDTSTPDVTGNAILNTRLALSHMANEPTAEGLLWLGLGKSARKGGLYQVAEHSLTRAHLSFCRLNDTVTSSTRELIGHTKLQVAKLKHAIGESTTALKLVEDDIPISIFLMDETQLKSYFDSKTTNESGEAIARRVLQSTEWMACDGLKSSSEITDRYRTVLKLAPNWERAHFNYAKFLDSLVETRKKQMKVDDPMFAVRANKTCQEHLLDSVRHYGAALQLSQKHVYHALPRLLTIWLEFTSLETEEVTRNDCSNENGKFVLTPPLREHQTLMNKLIKDFASQIPERLFYTALPQLISRVVHKNTETSRNVILILESVLAKYPQQSLWACGWLRFSKSEEKKKAGERIFVGAQRMLRAHEKGKLMRSVLKASSNLFQFFISLAQFIPKDSYSSVKMKIPRFDTDLKHFIPPIQAALSLTPGALECSTTVDAFPTFVPRMRAFNPELKVMQSKAKPKKVSIFAVPSTVAQCDTLPDNPHTIAQDAGEMHFLVKQEVKGDLRKDSRVQDLNNVINRLFSSRKGSSGPNSRRRRLRLQLRTFSVVCLAEDCGILEWVPHTESLRSVITETYNPQFAPNSVHRHGSRITNFADAELRNTFLKCQDVYFKKGNLNLATKKFSELILNQYLPVMYWWFVQNFSSPHSWFEARTNFTLSTAVWSAVGHIIGLGDRHSENLLIDTSSGECVHVDFDCIFDKGLLLPTPEVIPFRLTPNMLDAFGPTGANGMYTGALTESMRTLRKNRDTLLSVLEPFLNDPVINFKSKSQRSREYKDAKDMKTAMDSIAKIKGRLDGEYNLINPNKRKFKNKDAPATADSTHFTKLSVEGQVQKMIMEATSHENLVQVYVGWMPWV